MTTGTSRPGAARSWPRLALVEALQLPPIALLVWGAWPGAVWAGALIGSLVCCAGTDSGWRWRNRLLVAQAVVWLTLALVFGWRD
jgi:hypothetical protein